MGEANSYLIAAAPELLEALEKLVIEYQQLPHSLGYEYDLLPIAIKAIKKAKGE